MSRHLLIDGDVLVYESAFAAQKTRYTLKFENSTERTFETAKDYKTYLAENNIPADAVQVDKWLDVLDEHIALSIARNRLDAVVSGVANVSRHNIFLTGEGNYREKVATTQPYKGNRVADKPVHYDAVKEFFLDRRETILMLGEEADDGLGICATNPVKGTTPVVCTIDKDLNMIAGLHYNWGTDQKYKVTQHDAEVFFIRQLITGDTTDNIVGLKGYGPAKAKQLTEGCTSLTDMLFCVQREYESNGHDAAYLQEQGQLLWIRRKEAEMWTFDYYLNEVLHGR